MRINAQYLFTEYAHELMKFILEDVVFDPVSHKLELDTVDIPQPLSSSAPPPDAENLTVRSRFMVPSLEGDILADSISFREDVEQCEQVFSDEDIY